MKKYFILAVAAVGLLATACTKDETAPVQVDETSVVTFTVEAPTMATRAYGNGETATELNWAVYDDKGNYLFGGDTQNGYKTTMENLKASVEIPFTNGMSYNVLFWAEAPAAASPYTVAWDAKTVGYNPAVTLVSNSEAYDAFYCYYEVGEVNGPVNESVELKRPFAQLNIITNDHNDALKSGLKVDQVSVEISEGCDKFNFATGEGIKVTDDKKITFGNATKVADDHLAVNYLFTGGQKQLVNVKFTYTDSEAKGGDASGSMEFASVPVQRNYRTNIVGSLLTSDGQFNVEIKPEFDGEQGQDEGANYIKVKNAEEFNAAFEDEDYDTIILTEDIVLNESLTRTGGDPELVVSKDEAVTIDLAGHKLSSTSTGTGKNYNMFDVRGTLTVKNGTMEYEHKGDNMGWSNSTNLFNVTDGGVLNIEGVTAKNLGGSDMAFVAHLNNWGEVTLNVKNSVLESPYIAVRVYNSGNDMNNVTIKGSTLKGTRSFWVHNYTVADFGSQEKADAHKALLNFDIFNDEANPSSDDNTFIYDEENKLGPVCYGFTDDIYFDQYGNEIPAFIPILDAEGNEVAGVAYDPESETTDAEGNTVYNTVVVTANEGLTWVANEVDNGDSFAGKTIRLEADVDLEGIKTNGETFAPIGVRTVNDKPFKGTFDGNGKTISNLNQSGWDLGYQWGAFGGLGLFGTVEDATIKNLTIKDMVSRVEGGEIGAIAACAKGDCTFENITIESGDLGTYNNGLGGIVGYTEGGHFVFKDITIGEDVLLGGLWGSFDSSVGGIVGQADANSSYHFENVEINCRIDAYNDVTAAYKHYAYRMCGMIIGWVPKTQNDNGTTRPDPAANNVTCTNVTVNYGAWMNYTYCDNCCKRLEPGYEYGGHTCDNPEHTHTVRPFDQIFGGGQYGVYGLAAYDGVTVNYPTNN